jgi:hypothetical protein
VSAVAAALLAVGSLFVEVRGDEPSGDTVDAAVAAAREWLAVVDAGAYAASWDQTSSLFRATVSRPQWGDALESVRAPLGATESRALLAAEYTTSLPGAPEGEYVVMQFRTAFAERAGAIETVTVTHDADGWRVSGYFIR